MSASSTSAGLVFRLPGTVCKAFKFLQQQAFSVTLSYLCLDRQDCVIFCGVGEGLQDFGKHLHHHLLRAKLLVAGPLLVLLVYFLSPIKDFWMLKTRRAGLWCFQKPPGFESGVSYLQLGLHLPHQHDKRFGISIIKVFWFNLPELHSQGIFALLHQHVDRQPDNSNNNNSNKLYFASASQTVKYNWK